MERKTEEGSSPTNAVQPTAKRAKSADADDSSDDSRSDYSGQDATGTAGGSNGSNKGEPTTRVSMRKEKKSAREKARRQRENALFDELANMCNVPSDTRDKSSVLKAVIKRVEELRTRGNGGAMNLGAHFGTLSATSSMSSMDGKVFAPPNANAAALLLQQQQAQAQGTLDDLLFASARTWNNAQPYGVFPQAAYASSAATYTANANQYGGMASATPSAFSFPANALSSNPLPGHANNGQTPNAKTMTGMTHTTGFHPPPPSAAKHSLGASLAGSSLAFMQLPFHTGKQGGDPTMTGAVKLPQNGTTATDVFEASSSFNFA